MDTLVMCLSPSIVWKQHVISVFPFLMCDCIFESEVQLKSLQMFLVKVSVMFFFCEIPFH